jgi:uncharacterized protein YfaS (alpha-2-macroglobulin family)
MNDSQKVDSVHYAAIVKRPVQTAQVQSAQVETETVETETVQTSQFEIILKIVEKVSGKIEIETLSNGQYRITIQK